MDDGRFERRRNSKRVLLGSRFFLSGMLSLLMSILHCNRGPILEIVLSLRRVKEEKYCIQLTKHFLTFLQHRTEHLNILERTLCTNVNYPIS